MVGLVKRKNPGKLIKYFEGDFHSAMWSEASPELRAQVAPVRTTLRPRQKICSAWAATSAPGFKDLVQRLSGATAGILAWELDFSPPKSLSIHALAGEAANEDLVRMHLDSIDDALVFLADSTFERKMDAGHRFLRPAGVGLLRFTHAWNRLGEPQLHSHILVHRLLSNDSLALYGYPLYLLQRALRAVYNYALVARLVRADWQIDLAPADSLLWEMAGVNRGMIVKFAERTRRVAAAVAQGREQSPRFEAVETRLEVLKSRRTLPRSDPSRTIGEERKKWKKPGALVCPPAVSRNPAGQLAPVDLPSISPKDIFRTGSIISRSQHLSRVLGAWLGSPLPTSRALEEVDRVLRTFVQGLSIREHGTGLMFPPVFEAESKILKCIKDGFERSTRLTFEFSAKTSRWVADRIANLCRTTDRVRILSLYGEELPERTCFFDTGGNDVTSAVHRMDKWDPFAASKWLARRQDRLSLLIVKETPRTGDFLQRLESLIPRRVAPRKPKRGGLIFRGNPIAFAAQELKSVFKGGLQTEISRLVRKIRGQKEPRMPVVYAPLMSSEQCVMESWAVLESGITGRRGQQSELEKPERWSKLLAKGEWEGMGLRIFGNIPSAEIMGVLKRAKIRDLPRQKGLRCGDFWHLIEGPANGVIVAKVELRSRSFPLLLLQALAGDPRTWNLIGLVRRQHIPLIPGIPVVPLRGRKLPRSEGFYRPVRYITEVRADGKFLVGRRMSLSKEVVPTFFVNRLDPRQPPLGRVYVDVQAAGEVIGLLENLPRCQEVILISKDIQNVREIIEEELDLLESRRHRRNFEAVFNQDESDDTGFLAPRGLWEDLLTPIDLLEAQKSGMIETTIASVAPPGFVEKAHPSPEAMEMPDLTPWNEAPAIPREKNRVAGDPVKPDPKGRPAAIPWSAWFWLELAKRQQRMLRPRITKRQLTRTDPKSTMAPPSYV